jgi:hypothetical protein
MNARRTLTALPAIAAVAVAVAGCGGSSSSSSVSPAAYVKSVCTAATNWKNAIQAAGAKLQAGVSTKSLSQAKSQYVTFVSALVSATSSAASQLKAAGSPSVTNGKHIANTLVGIFSSARSSLAHAASQASTLPTSSPRAFETAANQVVTGIRGSLAGMSSITPEKNAALHAAAAKDRTCQTLAAGG